MPRASGDFVGRVRGHLHRTSAGQALDEDAVRRKAKKNPYKARKGLPPRAFEAVVSAAGGNGESIPPPPRRKPLNTPKNVKEIQVAFLPEDPFQKQQFKDSFGERSPSALGKW
ncbi:uncharacterized protein TM35_000391270 [Trypanosoma theileri]|uniref:Uncharacterized protein n=1 Tax=Trypanosoma theileri TaxID=67003 RepID=A0A1X0NKH1_9TRYP|nr:uncharacterized protein TM35_000391270 [Trypanosoma theileri]ORC84953.1 hypothetical protein TM35_000391270 [Trypanosoma theileri]